MISGGNATVFISNMDAAVRFYTEVVGLKLASRYGDHWATVEAGNGVHYRTSPGIAEVPCSRDKGRDDARIRA